MDFPRTSMSRLLTASREIVQRKLKPGSYQSQTGEISSCGAYQMGEAGSR